MILMQLEIPMETVYTTLRMASEYHIPVILNPAPAQRIDPELMKMITIITPNEAEAALIAPPERNGTGPDALIEHLKNQGLKTIIITLGENGVLFSSNGAVGRQDGHQVKVVDTTAAGDTFNGFLAVALAGGDSLDEAVRMANNAAAISVTRLGASTSIPFLREVSG